MSRCQVELRLPPSRQQRQKDSYSDMASHITVIHKALLLNLQADKTLQVWRHLKNPSPKPKTLTCEKTVEST